MTCHTMHVWVAFMIIFLVGCSGAERAVGPKTTIEPAGATPGTSSERVASDPQAALFARARRHVRKSPKCQDVLKKYPAILDNVQELPSQSPTIAIAFDHDEVIAKSWASPPKTRLNVRILVTMEGSALKSIDVKETRY